MKFADMSAFQHSYQFFMMRPVKAVSCFILSLVIIVTAAVIWSFTAKMDDVVKTTAFLRPFKTISTIKMLSSGEIIKKNYIQNDYISKGDLLLQLDVSAEHIELKNSGKLMERIDTRITLNNILLNTIYTGENNTSTDRTEAFIRSEAYLTEYKRLLTQIEDMRVKLKREQVMPDTLLLKQNIEDAMRELEKAELELELWKNNQIIETINDLQTYTQNKENLEWRISDLERNIRNASIFAPISGRINEYRKLNVGDYLLSGEEIAAVIPDDNTKLKAELYIDSANIAQVAVGQKVVLRFPGLPPSKFGKIEAEINLIPVDYILEQNSEPVFIVESVVEKPWLISPDGNKIYLRPGISASGRIVTNQDSVMRMILKKLDFINETYDKKALDSEEYEK
jgi:adhesin transport system membrane fusion protein